MKPDSINDREPILNDCDTGMGTNAVAVHPRVSTT